MLKVTYINHFLLQGPTDLTQGTVAGSDTIPTIVDVSFFYAFNHNY